MTEKSIVRHLVQKYLKPSKFVVANSYTFGHGWESDFLTIQKNGLCIEFEVKVTRSDFKADAKKTEKHKILQTGYVDRRRVDGLDGRKIKYKTIVEEAMRPNRFYYVVPEGLIKKNEIPDYAGLIYIGPRGAVKRIKMAPLLHDKVIDLQDKLMSKFYWAYVNCKL